MMDSENHDPAPDLRNAPGEFYVERDCCTLCGIPWHFAPELFQYDNNGCWVARQPETYDERQHMLKVIANQELGCVRSRGSTPTANQPTSSHHQP
jgi:hypothetical protein